MTNNKKRVASPFYLLKRIWATARQDLTPFPHFYSIVQIVSIHPDKPPTELAHPPVAGQQNGFCELHISHGGPGGHVGTGPGVGVGVGIGDTGGQKVTVYSVMLPISAVHVKSLI